MSTNSPTPHAPYKTGFRLEWRAKLAPYPKPIQAAGFTLIELSIVLVIIGLIVGGVLVGQDLINAAKIRSTIADIEKYKTAANTFRVKYNCLPGDCPNASTFGLDSDSDGNTNRCDSTGSNGNGDGNKRLNRITDLQIRVMYRGELANFWLHMSNAGILGKSLTSFGNIANNCNGPMVAGVNYPDAAAGKAMIAIPDSGGITHYILGIYPRSHNGFPVFGHPDSITKEQHLNASEAYQFDSKIDDGVFDTGSVKAIQGYDYQSSSGWAPEIITFSADSSTSCVFNAAYNVTYNEKACVISIR